MYKSIYDISEEIFSNYYPLLFLLISLAVTFFVYKSSSESRKAKIAAIITSSLLSVICIGLVLSSYLEFRQLQERVKNDKCHSVQGRIEGFHGKSIFGKRPESFVVSGVYFEYSNGITRNGYRRIKGFGGVLREGMNVKICYSKGRILKLQINE